MKNKVVKLFGNKENNLNYATLLKEFIKPFEQDLPDEFSLEDVYYFALNAWNFGNMSSILPPKEYKKLLASSSAQDDESDLLIKLVNRKITKFNEHNLFIGDFELNEIDEHLELSVSIEEQEEYLEKMLSEEDPFQMENHFEEGYINRSAIIIKPKSPFFDWINKLGPGDPIYESSESNIYLVREEIDDLKGFLKRNYNKFFVFELEEEILEKKNWPQNRNFKMFNQWFDVEFSSMIYDLENSPVYKEE